MDGSLSTGSWAKRVVGWVMTCGVRGEGAGAANNVAPTSLNKGRGEVVAPALVVVFHLSLKRHLVDGWNGGGGTSRRCQMREGGKGHGKRRETGLPVTAVAGLFCGCQNGSQVVRILPSYLPVTWHSL